MVSLTRTMFSKSLATLKTAKPRYIEDNEKIARLPEFYKAFYREWRFQQPSAVHYIPEPGRWKRNPETGQVSQVQNIPLPLSYAREMDNMLLGGEAIIKGFVKPNRMKKRVPRWWVPVLHRTVVHSEILNERMSVLATKRLLDLVHQHHGFDKYILQTPACDLRTELAIKIKRRLLLALAKGECYPDQPEKKAEILKKYAQHIIPVEHAEWYGLTLKEAMGKMKKLEVVEVKPLKIQFRAELLQELKEGLHQTDGAVSSASWLSKINPFSSKDPDTQKS